MNQLLVETKGRKSTVSFKAFRACFSVNPMSVIIAIASGDGSGLPTLAVLCDAIGSSMSAKKLNYSHISIQRHVSHLDLPYEQKAIPLRLAHLHFRSPVALSGIEEVGSPSTRAC